MEKVYILLPVHNRREVTQCFIDCLKVQTFHNYHLVLIDDGSTDGTEEMVKSQIQNLTVIKGNGNWWWAGSLQQGYLWLKLQNINLSDLILIINDDTEFENTYLETGLNLLENHKKTLLASHCYSQQTKELIDAGVNIDWQHKKMEVTLENERISCFSTKGLFLRWEDFLEIGGFHPRLLPHHAADYEFTIRAFRKGMQPMIDPNLKLWINELTTGYNILNTEYGWIGLKKFFSIKSLHNPITLTAFILLSCPWKWKIDNLLFTWRGALRQIIRFIFQPNIFIQKQKQER